jgi:PAS domain S-box-containing protein
METGFETEKRQLLDERAARVRAEALLLEKEQFINQLLQQNEGLQSQLSSVDALKKELHYVNEIVNSVQDIIFISDHHGLFRFINPAAEKLLGFPLADLLGTHYSALIRDDYAEQIRHQYRTQIRNGLATSYVEFPLKNAWQREIWLGQRKSRWKASGRTWASLTTNTADKAMTTTMSPSATARNALTRCWKFCFSCSRCVCHRAISRLTCKSL